MSDINWREAAAWAMPAEDRALIERLRQKAQGEDLTPREVEQANAIISRARSGVHDEAGERRLKRKKTDDEFAADLDVSWERFLRSDD